MAWQFLVSTVGSCHLDPSTHTHTRAHTHTQHTPVKVTSSLSSHTSNFTSVAEAETTDKGKLPEPKTLIHITSINRIEVKSKPLLQHGPDCKKMGHDVPPARLMSAPTPPAPTTHSLTHTLTYPPTHIIHRPPTLHASITPPSPLIPPLRLIYLRVPGRLLLRSLQTGPLW